MEYIETIATISVIVILGLFVVGILILHKSSKIHANILMLALLSFVLLELLTSAELNDAINHHFSYLNNNGLFLTIYYVMIDTVPPIFFSVIGAIFVLSVKNITSK